MQESEATTILLLPGWQNSGPGHWQTRWEAAQPGPQRIQRVEQHDWMRPLRGDWSARLEDVVLSTPGPVALAAHSLGCILVAAWAAHSRNAHRVRAALLVAVPDVERDDLRVVLPGWAPIQRQPLPFRSRMVASTDDPYGGLEVAAPLAAAWGSELLSLGARGHLNADSGLGDWPEGHKLLTGML